MLILELKSLIIFSLIVLGLFFVLGLFNGITVFFLAGVFVTIPLIIRTGTLAFENVSNSRAYRYLAKICAGALCGILLLFLFTVLLDGSVLYEMSKSVFIVGAPICIGLAVFYSRLDLMEFKPGGRERNSLLEIVFFWLLIALSSFFIYYNFWGHSNFEKRSNKQDDKMREVELNSVVMDTTFNVFVPSSISFSIPGDSSSTCLVIGVHDVSETDGYRLFAVDLFERKEKDNSVASAISPANVAMYTEETSFRLKVKNYETDYEYGDIYPLKPFEAYDLYFVEDTTELYLQVDSVLLSIGVDRELDSLSCTELDF